jgi:hypothetical protein
MAGYIGSTSVVASSGAERKKTYSITGTTTSLTGLSYTVNQVHVFHNGVRLVDGTDFTATNGNSITLTNAAQAGDEVVVISYAGYQVSDTVSASQGGTFNDDVAINGDLTVDTNTLYVDSTNNKVGIGTSGGSGKLRVNGELRLVEASAGATEMYTGMSANGAYFGTADAKPVYFESDGTERMRIDSSGNIGIGTTSPTVVNYGRELVVSGANIFAQPEAFLVLQGNRSSDANVSAVQFWNNSNQLASVIARRSGADNSGALTFYTSNAGSATEKMRINTDGDLLVGKSTTTAYGGKIQVAGRNGHHCATFRNGNDGGYGLLFRNTSNAQVGSITWYSSSTLYSTSSDYRLKEDVQPMTGASDRLLALNPVNFAWKADGTRVDGFLAHELQEVVPEAATGTKDAMTTEEYEVTPAVLDEDGNVVTEAVMGTREVPDYQGIDQSKLVPLLTAALQEALTEIADLKARVTALEAN